MLKVSVEDGLSPFFKALIESRPDFMAKAMKSLGYNFMRATREGIRSGSPNGLPWQQRSQKKLRKDIGDYAPNAWFGRLPNALGYEYQDPGRVKIGWRSHTSDREATNLETGQTRNVNAATRVRWGRRDHPLKWDTSQIVLPKRPVFEPMWKKLQPEIPPFIESKLTDYLSGSMAGAAKSVSKVLG